MDKLVKVNLFSLCRVFLLGSGELPDPCPKWASTGTEERIPEERSELQEGKEGKSLDGHWDGKVGRIHLTECVTSNTEGQLGTLRAVSR